MDVQFFESITFELIDKQVALLALPALPPALPRRWRMERFRKHRKELENAWLQHSENMTCMYTFVYICRNLCLRNTYGMLF